MEFKQILFGLLLFVVFASLIVTPVIMMSGKYEKDITEISNGSFNLNRIDDSLENISSSAESYRERYSSATEKAEEGEKEETGWSLYGIISDTINLVITPFTLLGIILSNVLNIPELYINVFLGMLGLAIILTLWKLWKQGN